MSSSPGRNAGRIDLLRVLGFGGWLNRMNFCRSGVIARSSDRALAPHVYFLLRSSKWTREAGNIMLLTGYRDQMLVFNFNSTKEDFPKYEEQLRKSMNSISISSKESEQD